MTQLKIPFMKQAVLSLSGGMDSSTLLLHLLEKGYDVTAISFDYGQKHRVELERAQQLVDYINNSLATLPQELKDFLQENNGDDEFGDRERIFNEVMITPITYQVIKLDGLTPLLNSSLVTGGADVPEGHYENENMKATVVPNRNKIFSSIIQAVALSKATQNGSPCDIALGIHAGDHSIYPDCRQEFRDADMVAFREGNWDAELVNVYTPYLDTDKLGILKDGKVCCKKLGLNFDEVYKRTNTSYKPYPSGNSDYKSASSVERIEAFINLGCKDPVQYEDESGEVSWEVAKANVEKVLDNL
jgi:7-cyano-7-deazaguanine synthase